MRIVQGGSETGFTLVELVIVIGAVAMMAGLTVPKINTLVQSQRTGNAARLVERELQTARLKAVGTSHALRVKFSCPVAGQFRTLEVTGVAMTDTAATRCSPTAYPSPGPIDLLRSTPSLDSAVRYLPTGTTVSATSLDIEFSPTGQVFTYAAGVGTPLGADLVLTVTRAGTSKTVTINALGRVKLN
ncbi:MAG: hypothetical protein ABI051_01160 [Vicinamibacterales bacterium]